MCWLNCLPFAGMSSHCGHAALVELFALCRYELSLWARGASGMSLSVGMEALFGQANVSCPGGTHGQCSYTPQTLLLHQNWTRYVLRRQCQFAPDTTGYFGAAGMISVELVEQGVAWVDELALSIVDNRTSELD